jgi:hypothetical protein
MPVGVEEIAAPRRDMELVATFSRALPGRARAVVQQAEERDHLRPGAVAVVHRIAVAAVIVREPRVELRQRARAGVGCRVHRQQPAVLGEEREHHPQQRRDQPCVDLLEVPAPVVVEERALGEPVGDLEAEQEVVEGRHGLRA